MMQMDGTRACGTRRPWTAAAALVALLQASGAWAEEGEEAPSPFAIDPMESQRHLEREHSKRILDDTLAIMRQLETVRTMSPEAALKIMGTGPETRMLRDALLAIQRRHDEDADRMDGLVEQRLEAEMRSIIDQRLKAMEERMERVETSAAEESEEVEPEEAEVDEESVAVVGSPEPDPADDLGQMATFHQGRNGELRIETMTVIAPIRIAMARLLDDGVSTDVTIVRTEERFSHDGNVYRVLRIMPAGASGFNLEVENVTTGVRFEMSHDAGAGAS